MCLPPTARALARSAEHGLGKQVGGLSATFAVGGLGHGVSSVEVLNEGEPVFTVDGTQSQGWASTRPATNIDAPPVNAWATRTTPLTPTRSPEGPGNAWGNASERASSTVMTALCVVLTLGERLCPRR